MTTLKDKSKERIEELQQQLAAAPAAAQGTPTTHGADLGEEDWKAKFSESSERTEALESELRSARAREQAFDEKLRDQEALFAREREDLISQARDLQDSSKELSGLKASLDDKQAETTALSRKLEEASALFASERLAFEHKVVIFLLSFPFFSFLSIFLAC